jgi:hypothetical protein
MKIQKGSDRVLTAAIDQINRLRDISVGANFHARATPAGPPGANDPPSVSVLAITVPNASDLATSLVLVNDIFRVVNEHFKDDKAHNTALSAQLTTPVATDLATAITRANAIKAAYGTHRTAANVHFTNDATNTITAADASDQATLNTLLNELKPDVTAHIAGALAGQHIELID